MRIFISHGTDKSDPGELAFLDALEQQLRQPAAPGGAAHDVLLDRSRLEAGDDWDEVLQDWMAECELAILLLSPRALTRPWVQKEATILAFRKQRDAGFALLPLLLPGLSAADVAAHAGFSALGLPDIQALPADSTPASVASFVHHKVAAIQPPASTPLDRLQQVLENWIGGASATALEQACRDWLGEPVAWSAQADRARQRARVLARVISRGRLGPSITLTGMVRTLTAAALAREPAGQVLDLAASLWVDEEVAARLRAVLACRASAPVAAALNSGRIEFGATMTIWRALLPELAKDIYCLGGAGSDAWHDELVEGMAREFMRGNRDDVADEDEALALLEARTEPVFFVVPPPVPDAALLAQLHARFPAAIFIAYTGRSLPVGLGAHIVPLSPGLQLSRELAYKADYLAAKKILC